MSQEKSELKDPAPSPEFRPFFTRVESLRGIGALTVAGYHISGWQVNGVPLFGEHSWSGVNSLGSLLNRLAYFLFPGHAALMMFFAISGLVLHTSLQFSPKNTGVTTLRFLIARAFRIYPIIAVAVIVAAFASGWRIAAQGAIPAREITWEELFSNILLIEATINSTLWAIKVEVMMVPFILATFFIERAYGTRIVVALALVMTAASFVKQDYIYPPFLHNFYAFIIGMLIPTVGRQFATGLSPVGARYALIASVTVLLMIGQILPFYGRLTAAFEGYAAFVLLSLVTYRHHQPGMQILDWRITRMLGMASGSYYVLHEPLLPHMAIALSAIVPIWMSLHAPLAVGLLFTAILLILFIPIALTGYYLVEGPSMAAGRKVTRWLNLDRAKVRFQPT